MTAIFDRDGNEIADIPLSEKQEAVLGRDEEIVVIYHTPQLLRYVLGEQSGTFMLRKLGQRIVAPDANGLRAYADLQRAIKAAREQN